MNPFNVLRLKKCGLSQLSRCVSNEQQAIKFFIASGLICLRKRKCKICGAPMLPRKNKYSKVNFTLHCMGNSSCGAQENALRNSVFENSHLSFQKVFDVIVHWFFRNKIRALTVGCDVALEAAIKWTTICRKVCHVTLNGNAKKIGGAGLYVEVDETLLFRRKYNRGHRIKGEKIWIVGGICRETKERFAVRVKNRSRSELWKALRKHIAPKSILVTDGYVGYTGVAGNLGFAAHETVIHKDEFVNSIFQEIHTNTVEGMWCKMKRLISRTGRNDQVDTFLSEYVYRCNLNITHGPLNFGQQIEQFLSDMKAVYPGK